MIYFFTGAGISADSGLSTFRDKNGLWSRFDPDKVANYDFLLNNYDVIIQDCFDFYDERKRDYLEAMPNAAHYAIAELVNAGRAKLITTNIDMLHEKAGVRSLLKVHGCISKIECLDCRNEWVGELHNQNCPVCGSYKVKPGVVFFGEQAIKYIDLYDLYRNIKAGDIFIAVGCGHMVCRPFSDIEYLISKAKIDCSLDEIRMIDINIRPQFDPSGRIEMYIGHADKVVPQLIKELISENL